MGLATLIAFPLIAWLLCFFLPDSFDLEFWSMFKIDETSYYRLPVFLSIGILFGIFVIWMTELEYFEKSMGKYKSLLDNYSLNTFYVVFLSICAGFGEEVFFRGALQPLIIVLSNSVIGIWTTAIFFVAIHGYFSFKNKRVNIFAVLLTLFIGLLGWASYQYSLWLAIAAHFSYDLVLLFYYKKIK